MSLPINQIICGDALEIMKGWPDRSVNCCVTSPPYWGLRDYGVDGQIGLEATPEEFVAKMVEVFREVRRVLRDDGTCWVNLGDSYMGCYPGSRDVDRWPKQANGDHMPAFTKKGELRPKQMVGIPWRVALVLQADGWYLRQDIIWSKPNAMPESCKDRCTKAHEYIFLLTKKPKYYYDWKAIAEPTSPDSHARYARGRSDTHKYADGGPGNQTIAKTFKHMAGVNPKAAMNNPGSKQNASFSNAVKDLVETRNKRSVWTVPTKAYSEAHFATFPPKLIEPCILAGCPREVCVKCGEPRVRIVEASGGTIGKSWHDHNADAESGMSQYDPDCQKGGVGKATDADGKAYSTKITGWTRCKCGAGFRPGICLDPFMGSGTVAEVAAQNQRDYVGCELNPEYMTLNGERATAAETGVPVKEARAGQKGLWE